MHRFFIEQKLKKGIKINLPPDVSRQIFAVLRMKRGEMITLFDGSGQDFLSEIQEIKKGVCVAAIVEARPNKNEPSRKIILFQSLIKKDKMEWVVEKCTEIGVSEVVPVLAARSVKTGLNQARLEKIAKEAAEQSGRAVVPVIRPIAHLAEAISWAAENCEKVLFLHEKADKIITPAMFKARILGLFIGPEGGWSEEEASLADNAGFSAVSLGARVLRAETAAIIASYFMLREDLDS
ncbi:MAG: 16S rRNA (uracil(1498)-N(3))-methyltransferase [Candidatus Niyogibacteria bacterium]|nr:16S rRNA (uracil(1498)-N(3))-methyltransferase [Candidatus Niyogibacteria bacterium]